MHVAVSLFRARGGGRCSGPVTMIVTRVGRGDVGSFRRDVTSVRRSAEALVAIGDGADAGRAHRTCSPQDKDELRYDVDGRTRQRIVRVFIAVVIVIAACEGACRGCAERSSARRWRVAQAWPGLC
jgi:hypothetical protein